MERIKSVFTVIVLIVLLFSIFSELNAQVITVKIDHTEKYQVMEGFGAALAFYENWLTAHPHKEEIYEAIFAELGLDILRVRNSHVYDPGMINRVVEFVNASERVQGRRIPLLSTSWGPPATLKSNNDRSNGGTLRYSIVDGKVEFDYEGFANWWDASLDVYKANNIYPYYISIQNEPDYKATWESCLFHPFERVTSTDTIAGYNRALETVHAKVSQRSEVPKFLGPETIGLGYNALRNYLLHADTSLLDGIAHHLYHGVDPQNPWGANEMANARKLAPNKKFYQTEYEGGGWFNTAGLIYKSLVDEQVVAYLYWDLIWDNGGLVSLDNPWNNSTWVNPKGYRKTKEFYAFKQFSAFIHPGWQMIKTEYASSELSAVSFINPGADTTVTVIINRSELDPKELRFDTEHFQYDQSAIFQTTTIFNCNRVGEVENAILSVPPRSITTVQLVNSKVNSLKKLAEKESASGIYPNPFTHNAFIQHTFANSNNLKLTILDNKGSLIRIEPYANTGNSIEINRLGLKAGIYFYRIENEQGKKNTGRFVVID